jgi:hypothetical protein
MINVPIKHDTHRSLPCNTAGAAKYFGQLPFEINWTHLTAEELAAPLIRGNAEERFSPARFALVGVRRRSVRILLPFRLRAMAV